MNHSLFIVYKYFYGDNGLKYNTVLIISNKKISRTHVLMKNNIHDIFINKEKYN